jgi:hypothetical protein
LYYDYRIDQFTQVSVQMERDVGKPIENNSASFGGNEEKL